MFGTLLKVVHVAEALDIANVTYLWSICFKKQQIMRARAMLSAYLKQICGKKWGRCCEQYGAKLDGKSYR